MPWSWEWVVRVGRRQEGHYKLIGTGAVVGQGRVLTARHVVLDAASTPKPDLGVRREGGAWVVAEVAWAGAADTDTLDVAVLVADVDGAAPIGPAAVLSAHDVDAHEDWEAKGYPVGRPLRRLRLLR